MIKKECFTKEWVESFKTQREHRAIQGPILEKMIHALHLLELLKICGLDFVFKGGTSLILLLKEQSRFSIDIDVICSENRQKLEKILDLVVEESIFTKVDLDDKRSYKPGIPKAHYVFEFNSSYNSNVPGKILLDILIEKSVYPEVIEVPVITKWIQIDEEIIVKIPSIDSITGDKLTAYAPNTIGIPYYKGEDSFAMEICKQLFDLSKLFENISEMDVVNKSFQAFAKEEIGYRNHDLVFKEKRITAETVLQDTIDTCILIAKRDANKIDPYKTQFDDLNKGIRAFGGNFLMSGNFRIEDSIVASAKVAHLATKLLVNNLSPIVYYNGENINDSIIEHKGFGFLNKLKRQPDKSSFYYWHKTVNLLIAKKSN